MRYYQKRPKKEPLRNAIPLFGTMGLILAIMGVRQGQRPSSALARGALAALIVFVSRDGRILRPYWEIRNDRVVRRGLLYPCLWKTIRFSEIGYIGPITTGVARLLKYFEDHIGIRNTAGKRIFVLTDDPQAFLTDIRQYLPRITHDL